MYFADMSATSYFSGKFCAGWALLSIAGSQTRSNEEKQYPLDQLPDHFTAAGPNTKPCSQFITLQTFTGTNVTPCERSELAIRVPSLPRRRCIPPVDRDKDKNMQQALSGGILRTIDNVSLAYFADYRRISDSVRDLCTAGFAAGGINISQSRAQQKASPKMQEGGQLPDAIGAHSRLWRWKRTLAHDRQRRGADQMSGLDMAPSEGKNPTCSSFDLQTTLTAMHVPAMVITLLLQDVQNEGMFLLVDASDRVREADSILDRNAGYIRTQYLRVLPS
jgi:hypothetical protein